MDALQDILLEVNEFLLKQNIAMFQMALFLFFFLVKITFKILKILVNITFQDLKFKLQITFQVLKFLFGVFLHVVFTALVCFMIIVAYNNQVKVLELLNFAELSKFFWSVQKNSLVASESKCCWSQRLYKSRCS